ncbi:MAG: 2Fe-2S iron-sulfur cluster-binding protein [Desulfatiglandaceae bacterium]
MKKTSITINENHYEAEEGMTVLEVLRLNGIGVPTLCYHKALRPIGACKLCAVEVKGKTDKPRVMLSCILKAREGLELKTESPLVQKAREGAMRNLFARAPQAEILLKIAKEYNIATGPIPDGCLRCRLCIRVCKEVVGAGALQMEKREGRSLVTPTEALCIGCGTCANICPTHTIHMEDRDGIRTLSIREEIIGIHHLVRCEACNRYFASERFLTHVSDLARPHVDVKEHHRYCPTCSKLFSDRARSSTRFKRI